MDDGDRKRKEILREAFEELKRVGGDGRRGFREAIAEITTGLSNLPEDMIRDYADKLRNDALFIEEHAHEPETLGRRFGTAEQLGIVTILGGAAVFLVGVSVAATALPALIAGGVLSAGGAGVWYLCADERAALSDEVTMYRNAAADIRELAQMIETRYGR
ncbi:MAG: hypothetical protein AAF675_00525 [Pseudomonadota bacterium]